MGEGRFSLNTDLDRGYECLFLSETPELIHGDVDTTKPRTERVIRSTLC